MVCRRDTRCEVADGLEAVFRSGLGAEDELFLLVGVLEGRLGERGRETCCFVELVALFYVFFVAAWVGVVIGSS